MVTLTRAYEQLFARTKDERFNNFESLWQHCLCQKESSREYWPLPPTIDARSRSEDLVLSLGADGDFGMTDWAFSQLCRWSRVAKDTVNRLSAETAARVLKETFPRGKKPLQMLSIEGRIHSIHGTSYTRLHNVDLLSVVREFATDFIPPQSERHGGATGLYAGEEDMFCFLIDPTGWIEIDGEAFAPGFFLWNSECGRRPVGMQTFWFQEICANHLVWDATDVVEFTRKHTANVHESLEEIRRMIEHLVEVRDARRDAFAQVIEKAMRAKLSEDVVDAVRKLQSNGIPKSLAKEAVEIACERGGLTIWSLVDAITRINGREQNAGDRTDADRSAAKILALAAA
jgi:hypothetical protein